MRHGIAISSGLLACAFVTGVAWVTSSMADTSEAKSAAASSSGQVSAAIPISVTPTVPAELNPPYTPGPPAKGGAPNATPEQAAAFAWQEFIALNWAAGPQGGQPGQREAPSPLCAFGNPNCSGPTVWETFRGKVETFPGNGSPPPGYVQDASRSYGYDALPQYNYAVTVAACDPSQAKDPVPWVNLDETDQITLDNMYAGVVEAGSSPGNSSPQLIRFLAKSNRAQYVYVAANSDPKNPLSQWWSAIPASVVAATKNYLSAKQASPPPGSKTMVSQYNGTIEVKAAWRPLNPGELASGRFHVQTVRFYEKAPNNGFCYRDAKWGLVALHIIQKTPSAPYFIYATFEQADNLLTPSGLPVEDADGRVVRSALAAPTTPQVCLVDPKPASSGSANETPSTLGTVILTGNRATCQPAASQAYCASPRSQLFYRNTAFPPTNNAPSDGDICVNRRANNIPDEVINANAQAHAAIASYLRSRNIASSPWLAYKLVNVQYYPYDKVITTQTPNGSLYNGQPPYTARHPSPASYYQANIVVETNRALQLFSGGLSPNISTDWNQDGTQHKNSYYAGGHFNMGGCMGCHGSQGQNPQGQAGDFSVILARGAVVVPETPSAETPQGLTTVRRNRSLSK